MHMSLSKHTYITDIDLQLYSPTKPRQVETKHGRERICILFDNINLTLFALQS